ncbi:MAG TPA: hypothetical protein VFQ35_15830, partial [Polyangiaceae bacterium]|nr:hypothetical protein [Polyangiaceae bacterium]
VRHWLVGFEGRADGYRSLIGSDPETTLELAVLGGRRFDVGDMALDVSAGPGIAIEGVALSSARTAQASSGNVMARAPEPVEQRSGALPRLLVGARLGFSPRSVFRTFIGVDAELGPVRTSDSSEPNLSATHLPAYLVGLALGATVGSP